MHHSTLQIRPSRQRFITPDWKNEPMKSIVNEFCDHLATIFPYRARDWQAKVIEKLMDRHNVLVRAGTSAGKSFPLQAMALSKPGAIVLVVAPTLGIMSNQVTKLTDLKITAISLDSESVQKDPGLWDRVDRGEFQVVFATPEELLKAGSHFMNTSIKSNTKFRQNLVLVAIDECHLVWDWEDFRNDYARLGEIRQALGHKIPWLFLSATVTPGVCAYIHEVCKIPDRTLLFSLPVRRDNINLLVSAKKDGFGQLADLIPKTAKEPNDIPKTLVFVDKRQTAIDIAKYLRKKLPPSFRRPNTTIMSYYSNINTAKKERTLKKMTKNHTSIVICTDAFGLGIDIPDILRVIQWDVSPSLNHNSLSQRIGRAARDPNLVGIAVIYVDKSLLSSVPHEYSATAFEAHEDLYDDSDDAYNDPSVVAETIKRNLSTFLLPVTSETQSAGHLVRHVRRLYKKIKNAKEARAQAKVKTSGTHTDRVSQVMKIDPGVLWVLCTQGCRWRPLWCIYDDETALSEDHKGWCCDHCAVKNGKDPQTTESHDIYLSQSIDIDMEMDSETENECEEAIMRTIQNENWIMELGLSRRPSSICEERASLLKSSLISWRKAVFATTELSRSGMFMPSIILPDPAIELIMKKVREIITEQKLRDVLTLGIKGNRRSIYETYQLRLDTSILSEKLLQHLFDRIDQILRPSNSRDASIPEYEVIEFEHEKKEREEKQKQEDKEKREREKKEKIAEKEKGKKEKTAEKEKKEKEKKEKVMQKEKEKKEKQVDKHKSLLSPKVIPAKRSMALLAIDNNIALRETSNKRRITASRRLQEGM